MIDARFPSIVLVLCALLTFAACDTSSGLEGGGTLDGTVVLQGVGEAGPSPHLNLYSSPTDFDLRENGARIDLTGGSFPFDFRIGNLDPGTYYLEACFSFGCHFYQDGGDTGIAIAEGQTTSITLTIVP